MTNRIPRIKEFMLEISVHNDDAFWNFFRGNRFCNASLVNVVLADAGLIF